MLSKDGINSLDDDIENQREIDPAKNRDPISLEVSTGRPQGGGASAGGGLASPITATVTATKNETVHSVSGLISITFAVASSVKHVGSGGSEKVVNYVN